LFVSKIQSIQTYSYNGINFAITSGFEKIGLVIKAKARVRCATKTKTTKTTKNNNVHHKCALHSTVSNTLAPMKYT
jgi:hypothetical protein